MEQQTADVMTGSEVPSVIINTSVADQTRVVPPYPMVTRELTMPTVYRTDSGTSVSMKLDATSSFESFNQTRFHTLPSVQIKEDPATAYFPRPAEPLVVPKIDPARTMSTAPANVRIPVVSRVVPQEVLTPVPEPIYIDDEDGNKFGMRCVCGKPDTENSGLLVQCDKCQNWLHGMCVCVARTKAGEAYFCPFCLGRRITCPKGDNTRWDLPIIQCSRCGSWVHKSCEDLDYGIAPNPFVCSRCGGKEFGLPLAKMDQDVITPNKITFFECNKYEILQEIPDGRFRDMVTADFEKSEINLHETVGAYFQIFGPLFFEKKSEFWQCFVDTFSKIFACDKHVVMSVIDSYAVGLLYQRTGPLEYSPIPSKFTVSESIRGFVESTNTSKYDEMPQPAELYVGRDSFVHSKAALEDGQFICDLPGFCLHTDEINANNGLQKTCLTVTNKDVVVDLGQSSFNMAHNLARSFHYNTVVKLYKVSDEPRVGLFAARMKGPLSEEKSKKGPAIQADAVLYVPLDGDLPFVTQKIEWKDRRGRGRIPARTKQPEPAVKQNGKKKQQRPRKGAPIETPVTLSLLSAFLEDIVPPIPIIVKTEKELEEIQRVENSRTRGRHKKIIDE